MMKINHPEKMIILIGCDYFSDFDVGIITGQFWPVIVIYCALIFPGRIQSR